MLKLERSYIKSWESFETAKLKNDFLDAKSLLLFPRNEYLRNQLRL